jgi:hypothetical protein
MVDNDKVWFKDPGVLITGGLFNFFPLQTMTANQRSNSVLRLSIYAGMAIFLFNRKVSYLGMIVALGGILSLLMSSSFSSMSSTNGQDDADIIIPTSGLYGWRTTQPGTKSGPAAMEGSLPLPPNDVSLSQSGEAVACSRPTPHNPFGNMTAYDIATNPNRPPACPYDDVKEEQRAYFNKGLVRNLTDVYERENSQRQFYTVPVSQSIPDTKSFANFLYAEGLKRSCKADPLVCPTR